MRKHINIITTITIFIILTIVIVAINKDLQVINESQQEILKIANNNIYNPYHSTELENNVFYNLYNFSTIIFFAGVFLYILNIPNIIKLNKSTH